MPDENGIEIRWLLNVILRRWWLIAGLAVLTGVVAFLVTSWMPPVYEASATLLVSPNADSNTSEYTVLITGERLALTYSQMLKGWTVLEAVIKKLNLTDTPTSLAANITAVPIANTQLIRLTVKSSSPAKAALLANTIAEAFVAHVRTLSVERYADSMNTTQEKMESLSSCREKPTTRLR